MTGQGKALVCAVGENTLKGRETNDNDLVIKEEKTYLEIILEKAAKGISEYSFMAFMMCIVA